MPPEILHQKAEFDVAERLKQIRQKYQSVSSLLDLLALKEEIKSFLNDLRLIENKTYEKLSEEAENMLMDITFKIEEGRCKPFRSSRV